MAATIQENELKERIDTRKANRRRNIETTLKVNPHLPMFLQLF